MDILLHDNISQSISQGVIFLFELERGGSLGGSSELDWHLEEISMDILKRVHLTILMALSSNHVRLAGSFTSLFGSSYTWGASAMETSASTGAGDSVALVDDGMTKVLRLYLLGAHTIDVMGATRGSSEKLHLSLPNRPTPVFPPPSLSRLSLHASPVVPEWVNVNFTRS